VLIQQLKNSIKCLQCELLHFFVFILITILALGQNIIIVVRDCSL
jgi:hypothetical protein